MRRRVYISGPLTSSGNELENIASAVEAMRDLISAGFAPFTPHLSYYADPGGDIPHATWLEVDLAWLEVAHAVIWLAGESRGADMEVARARALQIPIFGSVAEVVQRFSPTSHTSQHAGHDRSGGPLSVTQKV